MIVKDNNTPVSQDGRIQSGSDGSIKSPLLTGVITGGFGIVSSIIANRQRERLERERRAYEEQQIQKQNRYNSPEQQIQRYLDAGYTESQAYSLLYGSPDPGQQTSVVAGNAPEYTDPFPMGLDAAMNGARTESDIMNAASLTSAEVENLMQNTAYKKATQQFQIDFLKMQTEYYSSLKGFKDLEIEMQRIVNNIKSMALPYEQSALIAQYAATTVSLSGYMNMSPEQQIHYGDMLMENMFKEASAKGYRYDADAAIAKAEHSEADYSKELWEYMKEHRDVFFSEKLAMSRANKAEAGARISKSKYDQKLFDFYVEKWDKIRSTLESQINASYHDALYKEEDAAFRSLNRQQLVSVYYHMLNAQYQSAEQKASFEKKFYSLCEKYGTDRSSWKVVWDNMMWSMGINSTGITPPGIQNQPFQLSSNHF